MMNPQLLQSHENLAWDNDYIKGKKHIWQTYLGKNMIWWSMKQKGNS